MFLSFCISSSAVWISMKLRGDPVSANQLSLLLFLKVVCMIISPCGVVLFRSWFLMSLKSLSMRLILFQSSISSVMYIVGSGSIVSISSSSSSNGGAIVWLSSSFMFFTFLVCCCCCVCWNCPLFFGSGGICDLHIFAKCPGFLNMLNCEIFAGQLLLWLGVKNPPHLQHCGY